MAKEEQRIANKRERRQGREVTQRWTTAVRPRRKRVITEENEEEWRWPEEDTNQVPRRRIKKQKQLEGISLAKEIEFDLTEENLGTTQKDIPLSDGNGSIDQEKWYEAAENIRPQTSLEKRPWLLAILILPAVAAVTLLVGFYKIYKRISLAHP